MTPNLLVLGGTLEATALCNRLVELKTKATLSLAGRVEHPRQQPLPVRIGGFGGVGGLIRFIKANAITHVIDATHPFSAQMSKNAVDACAELGLPLVAFTRAAWQAGPDDNWQLVPDIAGAVSALDQPAKRILLGVGRMNLPAFAQNPQHHYVVRLVDPPEAPLPLPDTKVIVDRGPFETQADIKLMREIGIDLVVSKNSGGTGAVAKIHAARALGLPVIMIDRPAMPRRQEVFAVEDVENWLRAHDADLGV